MVVEESTLEVANCGMGQNKVTEEISWVGHPKATARKPLFGGTRVWSDWDRR